MATFPSIDPSFGLTKASSPQVTNTQFQDGYSKRIKWGMNIDPKKWNPRWVNITEADSDTIETFLEARVSDGDSFAWTPPNEAAAGRYTCESWNKTMNYAGRADITANFTEVFEP
jgi:phage-related protein